MGDGDERRRSILQSHYNRILYGSSYPYEGFDKEYILERDSYTCQMCGFQPYSWEWIWVAPYEGRWEDVRYGALVAHHLDHNKLNNRYINLVTLCHHCHMLHHKNYNKDKFKNVRNPY